jgi:hypothetical protein
MKQACDKNTTFIAKITMRSSIQRFPIVNLLDCSDTEYAKTDPTHTQDSQPVSVNLKDIMQ